MSGGKRGGEGEGEGEGGGGGEGGGEGKRGRQPVGYTFWVLHGVLAASADNWRHADLEGVWRQARAVRAVLRRADRPLARKLHRLDEGGTDRMPYAFLFSAIFLRLKRLLRDEEEAMRCWCVRSEDRKRMGSAVGRWGHRGWVQALAPHPFAGPHLTPALAPHPCARASPLR